MLYLLHAYTYIFIYLYAVNFLTYSNELPSISNTFEKKHSPIFNFEEYQQQIFLSTINVSNNKLQTEKAIKFIEEVEEDLKNISGKCMDVGCGLGDVTKEIILPTLCPNTVVIGKKIIVKKKFILTSTTIY